MDLNLSLAEKRLLLALKDGQAHATGDCGFATEGEALQAAGGPQRQGLLEVQESSVTATALTPLGLEAKAKGPIERRVLRALLKHGQEASVDQIAEEAQVPKAEITVAIGFLRGRNWAHPKRTTSGLALTTSLTAEPDPTPEELLLRQLTSEPSSIEPITASMDVLVDRGLVQRANRVARRLRLTPAGLAAAKGLKADDTSGSQVNQITPELLAAWATMTPAQKSKQHLRPFEFGVPVTVPAPGKAHPLTQIIQEIRDIFVALGFREITGDYVEPSFWNMDALFIPQDHPARDMQDTFYLKQPAKAPIPDGLFRTVRDVQLSGGTTGSKGWGGAFLREESERTLLRTHTTVTTIRELAANPKPPQRVFGIGRVFRNEAMDATHLPEFHQVEGIIVEEDATFTMLMGVLREFYDRLGFPEVKFRPSFYPYTEPSLDVAVKWGDRWLELGGAGVFRPEVTQPLGVPCNVLAWGLGLERLAMLRLGLKDIRQLNLRDVEWLRTNPLR